MSGRSPTVLLRSAFPALPERLPKVTRVAVEAPPERRVLGSYVLTMISICLIGLLLNLTLVGQFQHYLAQRHLYSQFRQDLAAGSVPLGQTDVTGKLTEPGTPIAEVSIPALGIDEIAVEGSTSWQTKVGIGHRRDTPLPGQPGVSVLVGRAAAYGGVFKHLADLKAGDEIDVLTAQGRSTYEVIGIRPKTTELPGLEPGGGRLTLATAAGGSYRPSGVLLLDATLTSTSYPRPTPALTSASLTDSEQPLAGDRSHAFALSWLLELLALLLFGAIWAWKQWGKAATWLVSVPVLGAVGLAVADAICGMLPNLM